MRARDQEKDPQDELLRRMRHAREALQERLRRAGIAAKIPIIEIPDTPPDNERQPTEAREQPEGSDASQASRHDFFFFALPNCGVHRLWISRAVSTAPMLP